MSPWEVTEQPGIQTSGPLSAMQTTSAGFPLLAFLCTPQIAILNKTTRQSSV